MTTVWVLLGNGDGTFRPAVAYTVGYDPNGIVAADFSGNGILDLAVYDSWSNEVSILMGNGDGTFQPAVNDVLGPGHPGVPGPNESSGFDFSNEGIVAGDFNGDGIVDLAVMDLFADGGDGGVSILLGNGDGDVPAAGDLSRDRLSGSRWGISTATASSTWPSEAAANDDVQILAGNGDGTFRPAVDVPAGGDVADLLVGDFNGDGKPDLAVVGPNALLVD